VFITFYRDTCRYSEEELQQAKASGIGGDILYRAMQQQSADPLLESIQTQGGIAVAHEAALASADTARQIRSLTASPNALPAFKSI